MKSIQSNDLLPLADALGFPLKLGTRDGEVYPLIGEGQLPYVLTKLGLNLQATPRIIDSHLCPAAGQTTAVLVSVRGNLCVALTLDHKRSRLEAYVLDKEHIPSTGLFERTWSRLRFMYAVRESVRAHFVTMLPGVIWEETPNARRWVQDYLLAREEGKLTADDALEVADLLAFGNLDRNDLELYRKWRISTDAKKAEIAARPAQ